jgi:hypothetical protein
VAGYYGVAGNKTQNKRMVRYKSPLRHQTPPFHQANTLNDKSNCEVDTILKPFLSCR